MGYLSNVFDKYYYSKNKEEKEHIKNEFKKYIWTCLPYIKLDRYFKYKVSYLNIKQKNITDILEEHQYIEYKILKSRYNINLLEKEDLIKARINSNYGKYFDKEIYFNKKYYKTLANYKNIYFNYLNGDIKDENLNNIIKQNEEKVKELKNISLNRKYNMEWKNYKIFVNQCLDKIFDNYKSIDWQIQQNKFQPNHILDWDEDNYIIGYVNKSLNGYLKSYLREITGFNKCHKWKNNLGEFLNMKGIKEKYTPLQLCIGRYYCTEEELLTISNKNILKLTKRQRKLIEQIKQIIDKYDEKEIILFNNYGTPYISQAFITNYINDKYKWNVITMTKVIYERINSKDSFCVNCGKKIIKKPNKTKYCKKCAREKELEKYKKYNKKRKNNH